MSKPTYDPANVGKPMTLAERLRAVAEHSGDQLLREAANEIESLQRECSVLRNEIDRCNGLCISDDADRIRDQREGGKLADDKDTLEDSDERDFEAWRESK